MRFRNKNYPPAINLYTRATHTHVWRRNGRELRAYLLSRRAIERFCRGERGRRWMNVRVAYAEPGPTRLMPREWHQRRWYVEHLDWVGAYSPTELEEMRRSNGGVLNLISYSRAT